MYLVAIHPRNNDSTAAIKGALLGYKYIDKKMNQIEFYKNLKKILIKLLV